MPNSKNLEIERKFLVRGVKLKEVYDCAEGEVMVSEIEQTYLIAEEGERRVRKRVTNGTEEYFYTEKRKITELKRVETERKITQEEYHLYLTQADPELQTIRKTRYTFRYADQTIELDVFSFSKHLAIVEVELPEEGTAVELPDFMAIIKEVTHDKNYKNHALAKKQILVQ